MSLRRISERLAGAAILALILLALVVRPGSGLQKTGYMTESFNSMQQLGLAISRYARDHNGSLPKRWADLNPNYVSNLSQLFFFNSPYSPPVKKVDLVAHPELIDQCSPYRYMRLMDGRIVILETPGFWRDGKITYFLQGADGKPVGDARLCHVTPEEFARRLAANFPDIPNGNSHWEEIDYGSGYMLVIDGAKLQTIHNAFLASGKHPISQEVARASAQAAIDGLDANTKWVVDAGVRTSNGSTPYYQFKCQFPKALQNTNNALDVYVLLDGTVLAPTKQR